MEPQVKELQKGDVKACGPHDEFNHEKQLMEGKYIIVHRTLEVA